jgi:DNA-binding NarL/FixJ family response regulator
MGGLDMEISEKARELKNAYMREWKRKNPDKVRKHIKDYWERKAASYTPEVSAKEMYSQGYTQREIATMLGVSVGTVNKYVNKE